jgi:hypothetical protein
VPPHLFGWLLFPLSLPSPFPTFFLPQPPDPGPLLLWLVVVFFFFLFMFLLPPPLASSHFFGWLLFIFLLPSPTLFFFFFFASVDTGDFVWLIVDSFSSAPAITTPAQTKATINHQQTKTKLRVVCLSVLSFFSSSLFASAVGSCAFFSLVYC